MKNEKLRTLMRNETGRWHTHNGIQTQDRCAVRNFEQSKTCMVASVDGATNAKFSTVAADTNIKVAEIIAQNADYYFGMPEKTFRKNISTLLLDHLTDSGMPIQELCATLSFVVVNFKTNEYLAFSVGDSGVYVLNSDLEVLPLLRPLNGIKQTETIFTNNSSFTRKYGFYKKGHLTSKIAGFITYTDGAGCIRPEDFRQLAADMLISETAATRLDETIIEKAKQITSDDISYVLAVIPSEQAMLAASALCDVLPDEEAPQTSEPELLLEEKPQPEEEPARTIRASHRFSGKRTVLPAVDTKNLSQQPQLPPLLTYLDTPRTADELIAAELGFDKMDFITEIAVLMRLGLVTCAETGGKIRFTACKHAS